MPATNRSIVKYIQTASGFPTTARCAQNSYCPILSWRYMSSCNCNQYPSQILANTNRSYSRCGIGLWWWQIAPLGYSMAQKRIPLMLLRSKMSDNCGPCPKDRLDPRHLQKAAQCFQKSKPTVQQRKPECQQSTNPTYHHIFLFRHPLFEVRRSSSCSVLQVLLNS